MKECYRDKYGKALGMLDLVDWKGVCYTVFYDEQKRSWRLRTKDRKVYDFPQGEQPQGEMKLVGFGSSW